MSNNSVKIRKMVILAMLTAVILIMTFTPLGYLKLPFVEISFLMLPVALGAILLGPASGAILGAVFGITSFIQCFGMSAVGTVFLGVSPVRTFLMCMAPRVLTGWLTGLLYRRLARESRGGTAAYAAAGLAGPVLNTLLYMPATFLLFQREWLDLAAATMGYTGTEGGWVLFGFLMGSISFNAAAEALAGLVVSTALCRALGKVLELRN